MSKQSIISRLRDGLGIGPKPKPVKLEELLETLFPNKVAEICPKDGPHYEVELKWSFDHDNGVTSAKVQYQAGEEILMLVLQQGDGDIGSFCCHLETPSGEGGKRFNLDTSMALKDKGFPVDTIYNGQVVFRTPNS